MHERGAELNTKMKRSGFSAYRLPLIVFIIWGSLYVVSKPAMEMLPPVTVVLARYIIACIPMAFILKRKYGAVPRLRKEHLPTFFVLGTMGYGIGLALQQISNDLLDASLSSLLNSLCPITIFILAAILLRERINAGMIVGIIVALVGVYIILGVSGGGTVPGLIAAGGSVFLWSLTSVLIRKVSEAYDPIAVTMYGMLFGVPVLLIGSLFELHGTEVHFQMTGVLSVIYLGLVATALGHILWSLALSKTPAATCSMFYPVQPLTSAVMGVTLLGEAVTFSFVAGALIISAGILIAVYSDSRS